MIIDTATKTRDQIDQSATIKLGLRRVLIKSTILAIPLTIALLFLSSLFLLGWGYLKFQQFAQAAQISKLDLKQTLVQGWQQTPTQTNGHKNLLILGLDSLQTRGSSAPLTDTMLLATIDFNQGGIITLPLPRDLWNPAYQTKINALYTYGLERNPQQPAEFATTTIAEMTGLNLHHTLVISMENVSQIIDLLGGVKVEVTESFVDEKFPRPDVDVTQVTDHAQLYEQVEFTVGEEIMSGARALKYMRSRHGNNQQNTDNARTKRQQAVIEALLAKMTTKEVILNSQLTGQLYRYYLNHFAVDLPPAELLSTLKTLWPVKDQLQFSSSHLSIYPQDPKGIIAHPPQYLYDGQWVYIIRDQDEFRQMIQDQLLGLL